MNLAVVGAGWSGLAAAVRAVQLGHQVALFEASHQVGGRARALRVVLPDGNLHMLDNGQHILIGAYRETLAMLRLVGVDPAAALLRMPLSLQFTDSSGLNLPDWPAPIDALAGILTARGWRLADKWSLLRLALGWRVAGFACDPASSVAQLCRTASPRIMSDLIEPLCVSALNVPAARASAQVFLRVVQDSLLGARGGSNLLLPRVDLSALFPAAAATWLSRHGAVVHLGQRVQRIEPIRDSWRVNGQMFDQVVLAAPVRDSLRIVDATLATANAPLAPALRAWSGAARAMRHTAITTVYAWQRGARLGKPMLALHADSGPAQFVFDRGQLGGPAGLLAFVVSASTHDREAVTAGCLRQGVTQLDLILEPVQTVVEKHATFACTPGVQRPPMVITNGLWACGDYVEGPYPATLEGAVRCGLAVIRSSGSAL